MLSLLQAMSATNPDDDLGPGEDEADKSQRKRERERQRRTEMAGAFNDLAQLLSELDPDNVDAQSTSRRRRRRGSDADDFDVSGDASGMTRLLLINRATAMLRSLHAENSDLRSRVRMGGGGEDKSVYVMVPTLQPVDDGKVPPQPSSGGQPSQYYPYASYPQPDPSSFVQAVGSPGRPPPSKAQPPPQQPSPGPQHHAQPPAMPQHQPGPAPPLYQGPYYSVPHFMYPGQSPHPQQQQSSQSQHPSHQQQQPPHPPPSPHPPNPSSQQQPQQQHTQQHPSSSYPMYPHSWPAPPQSIAGFPTPPPYGGAPLPPSGAPPSGATGSYPPHAAPPSQGPPQAQYGHPKPPGSPAPYNPSGRNGE